MRRRWISDGLREVGSRQRQGACPSMGIEFYSFVLVLFKYVIQ